MGGGLHDARSETEVAEDMAAMLRGFLEQNPDFEGRDFYITGESYAGHYVPAISHYLAFTATDVKLNLKGIAIGNGLIAKKWEDVMMGGMKACQGLIYESQHKDARVLDVAALEFCQILAGSVI